MRAKNWPARVPLQKHFLSLQGLDADSCALLVGCLCTADAEQKVFVRKVRQHPFFQYTMVTCKMKAMTRQEQG